MSDAKKEAEALNRAKENGEALRIEVDGKPVVTFNRKGELKVHISDVPQLRVALKLIGQGLERLHQQVEHALSHEALLHLAMGAVSERIHAQLPEGVAPSEREPFAKGTEPLTFTMASPKGKAS